MVNTINSRLEILLTLFVFASSFLVLSIEKYWWGGFLTTATQPVHYQIGHHLTKIQLLETYRQELYTINNLIRLIIVASSISFFMIITLIETLQMIITFFYGTHQNLIAGRKLSKA